MNLRWLVLLLATSAGLGACAVEPRPARAAETERIVQVVADAISYPRQSSAEGFARAALGTHAAQRGELAVLEATDLHPVVHDAEDRLQAIAHLVFRVHVAAGSDGWHDWPAATICYAADFNPYGVIRSPRRVTCPEGARPLVVPPAPPAAVVPVGADRVLRRALRNPVTPLDEAGVVAQVRAGLAPLVAKAHGLQPEITVVVDGADVGIGVAAGGDGCVLGRRVSGRVEVWHPPSVVVQPGELSCSADTALAGEAKQAPH